MSPPPKDRTLLLVAGGAAIALVLGVGLAFALLGKSDPPNEPTVGAMGLVVESRTPEDSKMDPARPLRCFVDGQMVGELSLADCAKRNGVAAGSLDVGLDESGQLAAAQTGGALVTPLPPETPADAPAPAPVAPDTPVASTPSAPQPQPQRVTVGICWRYEAGGWQWLTSELTLPGCVQALFAGRCERTGGATYGRWGEQTLRLVPRRVEISNDGRGFRTLTDQNADCVLAPIVG